MSRPLFWPGALAPAAFAPPSRAPLRPVPRGASRLPALAAPRRDRTALGIAAILAGTAAFPLSDLASQSLIPALPPLEVTWLRYVVFLAVLLPLLLRRGAGALRTRRPGMQLLRGSASCVSTVSAILAFKFMAVPEATAIGFAAPTVVTVLAVLVLGERVGLRRWGAGLLALAGVLIIVRPGSSSFCLAALIPLGGAVASAVTAIATRLNRDDAAGTTLLYTALLGTAALSALVPGVWQTPSLAQLGTALVVGVFGALGTLTQVLAYRLAPASLLSPFTYVQLVCASLFSFLLLGTVPGPGTLLGGAVIAFSAVYTGLTERSGAEPAAPEAVAAA